MHTEQFTVVQHRTPREPATWPHQIGVVPSPAQAFQPRVLADQLSTALDDGGIAVLTGIGGVGKTQLAAAYARTAWQNQGIDILVWVTASDRSAIMSRYGQAGVELCGADADDPERASEAFLSWLAPDSGPRPCRWLIVLDDVADPDDLRGLWPPPTPFGRTVVTTRRRDAAIVAEGRQSIAVGLFSPPEAISYLTDSLRFHGRLEPAEQLTALASELGHLPLALAQAATYLIDSGCDTGVYRALLANRAASLVDTAPDRLPDDQTTPIAATWSLSIDRADQVSPAGLARPMLQLAAMLDSNGIPQGILTSDPVLFYLTMYRAIEGRGQPPWRRWWAILRPTEVTRQEAVGALRALHRLSLIDHSTEPHPSIRIHQLIQRTVRDGLTDRQHDLLTRTAADALLTSWPDIERDTVQVQALRANASALLMIAENALYLPSPHGLLYRLGESLSHTGDVSAVLRHYSNVAALAGRHHGQDHRGTIAARHQLAMWQGVAGDDAESAAALEDLLDRMVRVRGKNHPDTVTIRHDLAVRRGEGGDISGAISALTDVVNEQIRLLGPEHPHTLISQGNLARLRGNSGDAAGAAATLSDVVERMVQVHGKEHPNTLIARSHRAAWLEKAGDVAEAVAALTALLEDEIRVYGRDHREPLSTRLLLAVWRGEAGDTGGAVAALLELHGDQTRILGPEDSDTLKTLAHLAYWQGRSGKAAAAVETLTNLVNTRIRILGADHPLTLSTQDGLAFWQRQSAE